MRILSSLALLLLAPAVFACENTPGHLACLEWGAPTKYVDGTSIPTNKTISYRVYRSREAATVGAFPAEQTNSTTITIAGLAVGSWCFAVTATVDGRESSLSGIACKTIRFRAPTDGAIESPSDGAIEDL